MAVSYTEQAAQKRAHQYSAIPIEWRLSEVPPADSVPNALDYIRDSQLLTPKELEITESLDISTLLVLISTQQLSALQVTKAFAKRAAFAHQLTTCLTEILFEEAFARAAELDHILATTGKTVGPLHGLPISVKDCVGIKGVDSTLGWTGLINKPLPEDSCTASSLRKLGAILYVKTNVPQSLMMSDSNNYVFGQCVNPLNRRLISGGSSGGESSLVAFRGSPLGIGTDIGGSVRIPAALCGLFGLSPTSSRHPYPRGGTRQTFVLPTAGPIASSLQSIETYMEALYHAKPWETDPYVSPIPWQREACTFAAKKVLRIGFVLDDGRVKPQPPIARAVCRVVDALRAAGHEVVEWDAASNSQAYDIFEKAILSDGGAVAQKYRTLSGEPLIEGMLVGTSKNLMTTDESHQLHADQYLFEHDYLRRWQDARLDAVISPVTPWVGYKPWTWVKSYPYVGYTSIYNVLDWAALAIPVTTVTRDLDLPVPEEWQDHQPRNPSDAFNKKQYDFELVQGLPVGVQITCGKYGEERCIAVGKVIGDILAQEDTKRT